MRNFRKICTIFSVVILSLICMASQNFAAHDTTNKWLGLKDKGNGRQTGFYTSGTTTGVKASIPVIKIVEYTGEAGTAEKNPNQAIYCLKDGVGFGSPGSSGEIVNYSEYFNLKDPDSKTNPITGKYREVLPSGNNYNKLMWLLDNLCIPENSDSVNALLSKAGLTKADFKTDRTGVDNGMTEAEFKDIIEVVQQAAIWYITNAGDDFQPSHNSTFMVARTNGGTGVSLGSKYNLDLVDDPVRILYQYLIDEAENNASYDYTSSAQNESAITLDDSRAVVTVEDGNFIVGPYKIEKVRDYDIFSANITNGTDTINAKILDANKANEITGANAKEKIEKNLGRDFYISLPVTTTMTRVTLEVSASYNSTTLEYRSAPDNTSSQPVVIINKGNVSKSLTTSKNLEKPKFDLALRKFITQINGNNVTKSREPEITQSNLAALATGTGITLDNGTTARKTHIKDSVSINTNDIVTYKIRVYNEGEIDGYADEITDYLPEGLELVPASESEINAKYGWTADSTGRIVKTNYLSKTRDEANNLIKAFDKVQKDGKYSISYKDLEIQCRVKALTKVTDTHLKNVAEITASSNTAGITDRDSAPNDLTEAQKNRYEPGTSTEGKGYEDDDDYEDLVLPGRYFDLSLRKFITAINGQELKTNGKFDREPIYDVTPLLNGKTTASYSHIKKPIGVSSRDIITYTIRVYNEGQVDGYVDEIVDHLPPELEFLPNDDINKKYLWTIDESDKTQRTIRTAYLSKAHDAEENLIKAFETAKTTLDYKEVQIRCRVKQEATALKQITNIADITKSSNDAGLIDRDNEKLVNLPQDSNLPDYKGKDSNKADLSDKDYYYEGQEDDDDFEKVILEKFDLALRKFITGVNNTEVKDRVPEIDKSKFGTVVDGKEVTTFDYNHTKEPVRVAQNDTIIYTIRVYNEGTKSGYAAEIKDDIPDGLEFIVDNSTNKTYRWVMYDEDGNITEDVKKAKTIRTDYLSKEQEKSEGANLLERYDAEKMSVPAYKEVKVAFKVLEPNTSDRIIINHAEISKDTDEDGNEIDDIDSTPDKWNEGEDDQDIEKIYVKYFDLALRKWVSHAIIIEDGVQKEMDTGHYAEQEPEPAVKVELNKKRIENTIVKFRYQIRITNEGEIEGYATEISDYIPDGLKFNQADNPKWKEVNGKIVTDQLKDTLLKPGESATVEVVLTWINGEDNMGTKVNVAEISEDKNDSDTPDIDSTPNNKKEGEDDIDDAPVVLTVVTGSAPKYIAIISVGLAIVGAGIFTIKKYVL